MFDNNNINIVLREFQSQNMGTVNYDTLLTYDCNVVCRHTNRNSVNFIKSNNETIINALVEFVIRRNNNEILIKCDNIIKLPYNLDYQESVKPSNRDRGNKQPVFNGLYRYREPKYKQICESIISKYNVSDDSRFMFSQASFRKDGIFNNRIESICVTLTKSGERKYDIDNILAILE